MKRLALYTAVSLITLASLFLLWQLRLILLLLILGIFVAAAVRPFIHRLHRLGLPLPVAQILVYVLGLGSLGLAFFVVSRPLLNEVDLFTNSLIISYENLYHLWEGGSQSQQLLHERLPAPNELTNLLPQDQLLLPLFFGLTQDLLTGLGGLVLVIALSIYWSADQNRFERLWLSLLPMPYRTHIRQFWRKLETAVSRYLRLELMQSAIVAFLLWLTFSLLQLNYPILLALWGALAWFIPLVGVVFAAVPVYWLGLSQTTALPGIAAMLITILIMSTMEHVIEPRHLKHRRYSPLLILLVTIPLVDAMGLVGIILASPLAVAIQILLSQLFEARTGATATIPVSRLKERHHQLVAMLAHNNTNSHKAELINILGRLEHLIEETETTLET